MCVTGASEKKNLAAASNLWVVSQPQTHTAGKAAVAGMPLGVEGQKHTVNVHAHTLIPLSLSQGTGHNLITPQKTPEMLQFIAYLWQSAVLWKHKEDQKGRVQIKMRAGYLKAWVSKTKLSKDFADRKLNDTSQNKFHQITELERKFENILP